MSRWLAFAGMALLAGCSTTDRAAGGGGIEIPNGLEVAVLDSVGKPVAAARVRVLAGEDWSSRLASGRPLVVDSAVTGPDGKVVLAQRQESFWVEIDGRAGSARLDSRWGAQQIAVLASVSGIDGRIPSGSVQPTAVRLAGTDRSASVDASGRFRFTGVPRGSYALIAEGSSAGAVAYAGHAVLTAAGLERLVVRLDSAGVLLDDFEDGDIAWALRDLFGYSWWWLRASIPPDSMVRIYGITEIAQGIQGGGAGRWLGIHIADSVAAPDWSNFGLDLGLPQSRLPTLAHLTAVRLKVRGQGVWTLRLATESATSAETWIAPLPLDTAWATIRVPASAFASLGTAQVGLNTSDRLRNLVFQTSGVGRLDVDDIVLEGVGLQDWVLP